MKPSSFIKHILDPKIREEIEKLHPHLYSKLDEKFISRKEVIKLVSKNG